MESIARQQRERDNSGKDLMDECLWTLQRCLQLITMMTLLPTRQLLHSLLPSMVYSSSLRSLSLKQSIICWNIKEIEASDKEEYSIER